MPAITAKERQCHSWALPLFYCPLRKNETRSAADRSTVMKSMGYGQFISILYLVTEPYPACDIGYFQVGKPCQPAGNVISVVSPSTVVLIARMTSFTPPFSIFSNSRSIFRSDGAIPCMGDMTPPST